MYKNMISSDSFCYQFGGKCNTFLLNANKKLLFFILSIKNNALRLQSIYRLH